MLTFQRRLQQSQFGQAFLRRRRAFLDAAGAAAAGAVAGRRGGRAGRKAFLCETKQNESIRLHGANVLSRKSNHITSGGMAYGRDFVSAVFPASTTKLFNTPVMHGIYHARRSHNSRSLSGVVNGSLASPVWPRPSGPGCPVGIHHNNIS